MMTIEQFGRRLRARELTAVRVTEECLRRIEADNPRLNAFITRDGGRGAAAGARGRPGAGRRPRSRPAARRADLDQGPARRPRRADHGRHRACATATSPSATRRPSLHLRQAGAVFVGKTNLHEFAFGTTNEDSAFGPARNPHDPTRSPGGSSGGSAVSVAAGMALATIGTDTGGSIRIPAAACGIVGLKPSLGEVSIDGVVPLSRTLDHVGPLAQSVTDACLVYHALMGDAVGRSRRRRCRSHGLRLAVPRQYFCDLLDDEVRARFEEALERLRVAGAQIDDIEIHHAADIAPVYLHLVMADAAAYHAADARVDAGELHAERAAPARDGPLRAGRGLRAGARGPRTADAARWTPRWRSTTR